MSDQILRTIRLPESKIDELLDRLDAAETAAEVLPYQRKFERYRYRQKRCVVKMQQPGAAGMTTHQVISRNLSANGMCFLHGGYVHVGTSCVVELISTHGTWLEMKCEVVRCTLVEGTIHEVGVRFAAPVEPGDFCSSANKMQVLLVEAEPLPAKLMKHHLGTLGADVTVADTGPKAVNLAAQQLFDVIFMDIDTAFLGGRDSVGELRRAGYTGVIVGLSNSARAEQRDICISAGCDSHLPKPVTIGSLTPILESVKSEPLISTMHQDQTMIPLIEEFIAELPKRIHDIESAAVAGSPDTICTVLQLLRANAGGLGFAPISELAKTIEEAVVTANSIDGIQDDLRELTRLCKSVRSTL